jgi:hypothetical protein
MQSIYLSLKIFEKVLIGELLYWVVPNKKDQIRTVLLLINDNDSLVELFCRECKTSLDGFHKLVCIFETVVLFASCPKSF